MNRASRYMELACRVILGGTFLYAGVVKANSSAQFAINLIPFTFVPETWLVPISQILPIVEILGGIMILLPWTKRYGAWLLLLLSCAFIAILAWALANDIIVACSCFGNDDEEPSRGAMVFALVRDVVFVAMALFVLRETPRQIREFCNRFPRLSRSA